MSNLPEYHEAIMRDFSGSPADRAAIEETAKTLLSLTVTQWERIKGILIDDNEVSIAFGGKLKLIDAGKRISGELKLSYARKFNDEAEFLTPDFDQPELFKAEKPAPRPSSMAMVRRSGAVIDVDAAPAETKREQKLLPAPTAEEKPKKKAKKKGGKA